MPCQPITISISSKFLTSKFAELDSPIVITSDDPDPVYTWWIKELWLHMTESLDANMDLTDNVINAAHLLWLV